MQKYFALASLLILIVLVILRNLQLKKQGVQAIVRTKWRKDFWVKFFGFFFIYRSFAYIITVLPHFEYQIYFLQTKTFKWIGVNFCIIGLVLFLLALKAYGKNFRVGIEAETKAELVTTGILSFSRNPIYLAFIFVLLGTALIYGDVYFFAYFFFGTLRLCKQIRREEKHLRATYGEEYNAYCDKVRRFF